MWSLGHVRYVTPPDAGPEVTAREVVSAVLGDPAGLIGILVLLAVLLLLGVLLPTQPRWGAFRIVLDDALRGYRLHLPLILRLSAGIALMGAGVAGYWFVPHVPFSSRLLALVFMACGFGLLVGVAVTFLSFLGGILWLFAFATETRDVLMVTDVFAMLLLLAVVSAGRPSVDDLLVKALPSAPGGFFDRSRVKAALDPDPTAALVSAFDTWVPFVARLGLGVALLYAGLAEKFLDPGPAIATAERYGLDFGGLDAAFWVVLLGATEVLLGLGILVGIGTRPFAALAFLAFTSTLFALPDDPVVAHVPAWGLATVVFILGPGTWVLPHAWRVARTRKGGVSVSDVAEETPDAVAEDPGMASSDEGAEAQSSSGMAKKETVEEEGEEEERTDQLR